MGIGIVNLIEWKCNVTGVFPSESVKEIYFSLIFRLILLHNVVTMSLFLIRSNAMPGMVILNESYVSLLLDMTVQKLAK